MHAVNFILSLFLKKKTHLKPWAIQCYNTLCYLGAIACGKAIVERGHALNSMKPSTKRLRSKVVSFLLNGCLVLCDCPLDERSCEIYIRCMPSKNSHVKDNLLTAIFHSSLKWSKQSLQLDLKYFTGQNVHILFPLQVSRSQFSPWL